MTTYVRGAATTALHARQAVERQLAETERLYAEGRKLATTIKELRQRNANIQAAIAEEQEKLEDKRATLTAKLADIQAAQAEADNAIREAEANAATIRELAYDQARAITERAYRHGYDKGQDRARAQHAILRKYTPKPDGRNPGRTNQAHHGYPKDIAA